MTTIQEKIEKSMERAKEIANNAGYEEGLKCLKIQIEISAKLRSTWALTSPISREEGEYKIVFSKTKSKLSSKTTLLSTALHELAHVIVMDQGYTGGHGTPWKNVYKSFRPYAHIAKKHFESIYATYDKPTYRKLVSKRQF